MINFFSLKRSLLALIFFFICLNIKAQSNALTETAYEEEKKYFQSDTLRLAELYEAVWQHHPLIQKAKLISKLSLQDLRKTRGLFEPTLMGEWTEKDYKKTTYYEKFLGELKVPTVLGFDLKAGYENNYGKYLNNESTVPKEGLFYVGVDVPLLRNLIFNDRRATLQKAKIFVEMAQAEQQKEINKLFFTIAKKYWEWQGAYERVQVTSEVVQIATQMFKDTKTSFELGKYRAIDTTEVLMNLQKYQIAFRQALIDYEKTRLAVSSHLWSEDGEALYLKNTIIPSKQGSDVESFDMQSLINDAAVFHPELLKARFKLKTLRIDKNLKQFSLLPKLDLSYKPILYPQGKKKGDEQKSGFSLTENYKLGVKFYMPLLLRKERGSFVAARIKLKQQELDYNFTQRSVQIGIEQSYIKVKQYENMLAIQSKNVDNALTLRKAEKTLFDLGKSNVFLINYRQQYYLDAMSKLISLRMKYAKAKAELMWSSGKNQFVELNE